MKTIGKIFKRDLKKLFTNSMAIILAVGVAVLPDRKSTRLNSSHWS